MGESVGSCFLNCRKYKNLGCHLYVILWSLFLYHCLDAIAPPRLAKTQPPAQNLTDKIIGRAVARDDLEMTAFVSSRLPKPHELYSFVGSKAHKRWLWVALCRRTRDAATCARAVPITTVFGILFGPTIGVFSLYSANPVRTVCMSEPIPL